MIKIGIDCRLAGKKHAGIGRYIENLIIRLPLLAPEVQFVYFFYDFEQADDIANWKKYSNVKLVFVPIKHYSLAEQIRFPSVLTSQQLDLLHIPHFNIPIFYQKSLVVTIHDLLWHEQKGPAVTTLPIWQYWVKYLAYRFTVGQAVHKASQILVPAKTIQQTLIQYYPQAKTKTTVTYEGIDQHLQLSKTKKATNQLLYVGSLYPHKNIGLVLQALTQLPNFELTIVGARNVFVNKIKQQVQQLGINQQVHFLGSVDDTQLSQLYSSAYALVQPSLSEGFGLTGVEAMALGTPVIASDIPIFREIYQDAAQYFDPHDLASFCQAVKTLTPTKRASLIKRGHQVAQRYNWDTLTHQTLNVYQQVISSKHES